LSTSPLLLTETGVEIFCLHLLYVVLMTWGLLLKK
jgi:hypothetical protein